MVKRRICRSGSRGVREPPAATASCPCTSRNERIFLGSPLSRTWKSSGLRSLTARPFLSRTTTSSSTSSPALLIAGACGAGAWLCCAGAAAQQRAASVATPMNLFMTASFATGWNLARVLFLGSGDTDPMVRKLVVRARQLDLRHMAGDALFRRGRAGLGPLLAPRVAGLAFRVIFLRKGRHLPVRIVTGQAADAGVVRVVALAACQAIGLE